MKALHYLKYFLFHAVGLCSAAALLAGGPWIAYGLAAVLTLYVFGDLVCGDDTSTPEFRHPGILTFQLWLALPLLCFIVFAALWGVSDGDFLGFGAALGQATGYDLIAARDATNLGQHICAWVLTGLMIGTIGTITAHELTHRTWDPVSMLIGRWLLAGGISGLSFTNLGTPTTAAEIYDAVANTWTTVAPMATARGNHKAWALGGGQFLFGEFCAAAAMLLNRVPMVGLRPTLALAVKP